jgi:Phage-related minor tail protein
MIVAAQVIWGQQVIISYNNSGTSSATIPSCATNVTGHVWGGGGGGGSGYSSGIGINIGGGGGGGAYNTIGFTTVNQPFAITVGAGGTGGVTGNPGNNGASGSISSIVSPDYTLNANGGSGGGRTSGGTNPGSGGAGGSGGTYTGADGANGDVSAWAWSTITAGNGGGGAGSGGNASGQSGGQANGSLPSGGSGGGAVTGNSNGNPGIAPGGGGSGGRSTASGNHNGGNGGNGRAIIVFDISRPVISGTNNYCEGETMTLNVNNACTSANYIWKRDGNIEGYGATLTLNNLTPGKSGSYTVEYSFSYLNGTVSVTGAGLSSVDSTFTFTSVVLDVTVKPRAQTPLLRRSYEGVCPIDEGEADGYYSAADSLNIAPEYCPSFQSRRRLFRKPYRMGLTDSEQREYRYSTQPNKMVLYRNR